MPVAFHGRRRADREAFAAPARCDENSMDLRQVALPLYEARGWMRFIAATMLIAGALTALTIAGLVIAWLPIWQGVLLLQAARRVEAAFAAEDEALLRDSLAKLKTYCVIQGVLLLTGVLAIAGVVLALACVLLPLIALVH